MADTDMIKTVFFVVVRMLLSISQVVYMPPIQVKKKDRNGTKIP